MSLLQKIQKLNNIEKKFLTTQEVGSFLDIENQRTIEETVRRLIEDSVLVQLERGKYLINSKNVTDFEIAQFLYNPSYISFETALNYHGVLSQFPYEITSATTKKRISKQVNGKSFNYLSVQKNLFIGFYKQDDALIAYPEKALFDQLYMSLKGSRSINSIDEYDFTSVNKKRLEAFIGLVNKTYQKQIYTIMEKYL
jgi:hypothetical protein